MERAIYNIVENAAQALGPRGGGIKIRGYMSDTNKVVIEISNATVIPADVLPEIFRRYFTEGKLEGSGMGLAIAKQFIEAHGGIVRCTSSTEAGTKFTIEL